MKTRRCAHCGDELPASHKYVYCWDGLEEFTQRQREIEEDPFVTCVAYGDFTDPRHTARRSSPSRYPTSASIGCGATRSPVGKR